MEQNVEYLFSFADKQSRKISKKAADSQSFKLTKLQLFFKNKTAVLSGLIIVLITCLAYGSLLFYRVDPNQQNLTIANQLPSFASGHLFGTDQFGRDLLARTLYGTRLSLLIAVSATAIEFGIGISYGLISGWKGGKTDLYLQRFVEFISSIPTLVIVILMLLVFKPGVTSILIAMGLTGWITMSRVIRAETIKLKQQEFVTAAIILGEKPTQIARHHLLPNLMDVILTQMMLNIPAAIFFESFLSFIGIGIQVPNASLGSLLSEGYQVFRLTPHVLIFPSIILCLLMISFNLFGHGLRDVLDPKI